MTDPVLNPFINNSFLSLPEAIRMSGLKAGRAMIVGDTNTLPLYGEAVAEAVKDCFDQLYLYAFPAGEEHKNIDTIMGLLKELIANRFERRDCIIAVGGGVTGDMAGFAAAIYLRGIDVIQIPTTLLAQIDSGIGGKTAVDLDGFKNMVGAFHLPVFVYSNTAVLRTLPSSEFTAGMGEVIKSALLGDADLYEWLYGNSENVLAHEPEALTYMVRSTAKIKVDIVRRDPTEKGERALLNLGHTIGHAIEKYMDFSMIHGICVGLGLVAAAKISFNRQLLTSEEYESIRKLLSLYGLPLSVNGVDREAVLRFTKSDKKMSGGHVRFILIEKPGKAVIANDVTDEELLLGIDAVCEH